MAQIDLAESPAPARAASVVGRSTSNITGRPDATAAVATAIIPARGGSQGLPGKNLARVGGVPLVARAVRAALAAERIGRVVVTTDEPRSPRPPERAGAEIVDRPAEIAGSEASSESALLHALDALDAAAGFEARPSVAPRPAASANAVTVFIQATSPFIDPADLDAAIARVEAGERDVVFSAAPTHVFLWRGDEGARGAVGVNHDAAHRQRRQDRQARVRRDGRVLRLPHRRVPERRAPLLRARRHPARRSRSRHRDRRRGRPRACSGTGTARRPCARGIRTHHGRTAHDRRHRPVASAHRGRRPRDRLRRGAHRRHGHGRPARPRVGARESQRRPRHRAPARGGHPRAHPLRRGEPRGRAPRREARRRVRAGGRREGRGAARLGGGTRHPARSHRVPRQRPRRPAGARPRRVADRGSGCRARGARGRPPRVAQPRRARGRARARRSHPRRPRARCRGRDRRPQAPRPQPTPTPRTARDPE